MRKYTHFMLKMKNILVLDKESLHKIPEIKKSLELSETKIMMIPLILIQYFQLLNVTINMPSKYGVRKKYNKYWLDKDI